MRYGTVVQYFPAKGYGFIRPDSGPDVFFHVTALGACDPNPQLATGQAVKYELIPGTEPKWGRRRSHKDDDDDEQESSPPARPQAKLIELIDKIPGGVLDESKVKRPAVRHPRARHKKPTWRR